MSTIEQIRSELAENDKGYQQDRAYFSFSDVHTLLDRIDQLESAKPYHWLPKNIKGTNIAAQYNRVQEERDFLRAEVEALKAKVDELNGLRKYQASLSSKDCQAPTMIWGRGAYLATNKTSLARRLLDSPSRPAVMLLASSACSIAGIYSAHAVWFIIAALAFIVSAPF